MQTFVCKGERESSLKDNLILDKSFNFSVRIVNLYKYITNSKKEYVLSRQLLRSGTSIGANIHEGINGQSKKDFLSKMYIAFKEATETEYWIKLLFETKYITKVEYDSIITDCIEIKRILNSIIKTTKINCN